MGATKLHERNAPAIAEPLGTQESGQAVRTYVGRSSQCPLLFLSQHNVCSSYVVSQLSKVSNLLTESFFLSFVAHIIADCFGLSCVGLVMVVVV